MTIDLAEVAKTFERLFLSRTIALLEGTGSIEYVPEDARVLFSELAAEHPGLTIHDREELQPMIDKARARAKRRAASTRRKP